MKNNKTTSNFLFMSGINFDNNTVRKDITGKCKLIELNNVN